MWARSRCARRRELLSVGAGDGRLLLPVKFSPARVEGWQGGVYKQGIAKVRAVRRALQCLQADILLPGFKCPL